jgi:hypothetical protein
MQGQKQKRKKNDTSVLLRPTSNGRSLPWRARGTCPPPAATRRWPHVRAGGGRRSHPMRIYPRGRPSRPPVGRDRTAEEARRVDRDQADMVPASPRLADKIVGTHASSYLYRAARELTFCGRTPYFFVNIIYIWCVAAVGFAWTF